MKILSKIRKCLFGSHHEFDMDNPIKDEIKITYEYKLSGHVKKSVMEVEGFRCKKCDKVVWLDRDIISAIPKSMNKCEEKKT